MVLGVYPALLSNYEIEVVAFESAKEAVDYLKANHVDGVIADLDMPGCNGVDFFQKLKKENIFNGLFVFATGKWEDRYNYLLNEGVAMVFKKPFRHQDLATFLQTYRP